MHLLAGGAGFTWLSELKGSDPFCSLQELYYAGRWFADGQTHVGGEHDVACLGTDRHVLAVEALALIEITIVHLEAAVIRKLGDSHHIGGLGSLARTVSAHAYNICRLVEDEYGICAATAGSSRIDVFALKRDERIRISIPRGLKTISVTETPVGGYQTQYQVGSGSTVMSNVMNTPNQMEADTLVAFTNVSIPPAPTGLRFLGMPFVLMVAAGLALPAVLPRRRRRKKEED